MSEPPPATPGSAPAPTPQTPAPATPAPPLPAPVAISPPLAPPASPHPQPPHRGGRRAIVWIFLCVALVLAALAARPWLKRTLSTVSTDDAYVNGRVTFVAPRVAGQVSRVLVDDNHRVRRGDLLLQLDKEPYQTKLNVAEALVSAAQADVVIAEAQARGAVGQMRNGRFTLDHSIEEVNNQVALLRSKFATLSSKKATLTKAQADYDRDATLVKTNVVSKQEFDAYTEALKVAQAQYEEALQGVYQIRVGLGLPISNNVEELAQVPDDLAQHVTSVREAQARLIEAAAQLGVFDALDKPPRQMIADFLKRDPEGNIDRIYAEILKDAPGIKQAQSKLVQAQRNADEARLNVRYCDVISEIDGVVTRREVNPGNNLVAGQAVMAVRSLTDVWVDANFKETQLARLRIGQPVELDVDMYGAHQTFQGRISGFSNGTGSTLALLPAENATGNFVKVVQRLPVRIDLTDYDPERIPLFVGLSVTPHVLINESPQSPDAGKLLRSYSPATSNTLTSQIP